MRYMFVHRRADRILYYNYLVSYTWVERNVTIDEITRNCSNVTSTGGTVHSTHWYAMF